MRFRRRAPGLETLGLGFYGKLPQFGDFVAKGATSDDVRALDGWLQAGLKLLAAAPLPAIEEDYDEAPPIQFLFPPQGAPVRLHERLAESEERLLAYLREGLVAALPDLPDPEYSARVVLASGRELLRMRLLEPRAATHERLLALVRRMRVSGGS